MIKLRNGIPWRLNNLVLKLEKNESYKKTEEFNYADDDGLDDAAGIKDIYSHLTVAYQNKCCINTINIRT